jgi:FkbM family methyltransferase
VPVQINVVVLTYLNDYARRTISLVNEQSFPAARRILLVDAGHSDMLVKIAALNDLLTDWLVIVRPAADNFAAHRNSVLSLVPSDEWILMLDDDELISRDCLASIDLHLRSITGPIDVLMLARINTFGPLDQPPAIDWMAPDGFHFPDWQARVFRNNGVVRYEGKVHETLGGARGQMGVQSPQATLLHHKTSEMQAASGLRWHNIQGAEHAPIRSRPTYYSQCKEDVLIDFLLENVGNFCAENVVELGAGDPCEFSNSRMLIERGWKALLVEANIELAGRLSQEYAQSDAVVVRHVAVSDRDGEVDFYVSNQHWALSGVGRVSQSERHSETDIAVVRIPAVRGSQLLADWARKVGQVGLLVIDLEGLDLHVITEILSSANPTRPDVLLVVALTGADGEAEAAMLTAEGYVFARNCALSNLWLRSDLPECQRLIELATAAPLDQ